MTTLTKPDVPGSVSNEALLYEFEYALGTHNRDLIPTARAAVLARMQAPATVRQTINIIPPEKPTRVFP